MAAADNRTKADKLARPRGGPAPGACGRCGGSRVWKLVTNGSYKHGASARCKVCADAKSAAQRKARKANGRSAEEEAARPIGGPAGPCGTCGAERVWKLEAEAKHGAGACCKGCKAARRKAQAAANKAQAAANKAKGRSVEDEAARPIGGPAPACETCGAARVWAPHAGWKHGAQAHCADCVRANTKAQRKARKEKGRSADDEAARPIGGPAGPCGKCGAERVWRLEAKGKHGATARCAGCWDCLYAARKAKARSAEDEAARPLGGPAPGACRVCVGERVWALSSDGKHGASARCKGCPTELLKKNRSANPEKFREHNANRRARIAGAVCGCGCRGRGFGTLWVGRKCYVCKLAAAESTDHIQPLAEGGLHCPTNWAAACLSCNSAKGDHVWPGEAGWESFLASRRKQAQGSEDALGREFCPGDAQVSMSGVLSESTQFRWSDEPML